MKKIKLTCAHAIIKYLIAQKILIDGKKEPVTEWEKINTLDC